MHQNILVNITDSLLGCFYLAHSQSGMKCQNLTSDIGQCDLFMVDQCQTSHTAACECLCCLRSAPPRPNTAIFAMLEFFLHLYFQRAIPFVKKHPAYPSS